VTVCIPLYQTNPTIHHTIHSVPLPGNRRRLQNYPKMRGPQHQALPSDSSLACSGCYLAKTACQRIDEESCTRCRDRDRECLFYSPPAHNSTENRVPQHAPRLDQTHPVSDNNDISAYTRPLGPVSAADSRSHPSDSLSSLFRTSRDEMAEHGYRDREDVLQMLDSLWRGIEELEAMGESGRTMLCCFESFRSSYTSQTMEFRLATVPDLYTLFDRLAEVLERDPALTNNATAETTQTLHQYAASTYSPTSESMQTFSAVFRTSRHDLVRLVKKDVEYPKDTLNMLDTLWIYFKHLEAMGESGRNILDSFEEYRQIFMNPKTSKSMNFWTTIVPAVNLMYERLEEKKQEQTIRHADPPPLHLLPVAHLPTRTIEQAISTQLKPHISPEPYSHLPQQESSENRRIDSSLNIAITEDTPHSSASRPQSPCPGPSRTIEIPEVSQDNRSVDLSTQNQCQGESTSIRKYASIWVPGSAHLIIHFLIKHPQEYAKCAATMNSSAKFKRATNEEQVKCFWITVITFAAVYVHPYGLAGELSGCFSDEWAMSASHWLHDTLRDLLNLEPLSLYSVEKRLASMYRHMRFLISSLRAYVSRKKCFYKTTNRSDAWCHDEGECT
jgi:hypothetical protein